MIPLHSPQPFEITSKSPFYLYKFKNPEGKKLDDYKIFPGTSSSSFPDIQDNISNCHYHRYYSSFSMASGDVSYKNSLLDGTSCTKQKEFPHLSSIPHFKETLLNSSLDNFSGIVVNSGNSTLPLLKLGRMNKPHSSSSTNNFTAECLPSCAYAQNETEGLTYKYSTNKIDLANHIPILIGDASESEDNEDYFESMPVNKKVIIKCPYANCKYDGGFLTKDYLRRHIREQHRGTKGSYCRGTNRDGSTWGCSKKFKRPYQLINHWKGKRSLKKCGVPKQRLLEYGISI